MWILWKLARLLHSFIQASRIIESHCPLCCSIQRFFKHQFHSPSSGHSNIGKLETINDYDDDDRISFFRVIHLACFFLLWWLSSNNCRLSSIRLVGFHLVCNAHTHTQIYAKTGFHRFQSIPDDIHYVIIQVITFFHCLRW